MIRTATAADAAAIGALKVRAWRAAYATFMPAGCLAALDPSAEAAAWADYLAAMPTAHRLWSPTTAASSAFAAAARPTTLTLEARLPRSTACTLSPTASAPGWAGRALFGHAVADLDKRGCRPVCVYAYTPNSGAIRFYQRAGLALDGASRLDQHDGIGVREVRLVK